MLAYMIMRLVYGTYVVVAVLILVRALSLMIFRRKENEFKGGSIRLLFAFIWPLALFSRDGRRYLKEALPVINRVG